MCILLTFHPPCNHAQAILSPCPTAYTASPSCPTPEAIEDHHLRSPDSCGLCVPGRVNQRGWRRLMKAHQGDLAGTGWGEDVVLGMGEGGGRWRREGRFGGFGGLGGRRRGRGWDDMYDMHDMHDMCPPGPIYGVGRGGRRGAHMGGMGRGDMGGMGRRGPGMEIGMGGMGRGGMGLRGRGRGGLGRGEMGMGDIGGMGMDMGMGMPPGYDSNSEGEISDGDLSDGGLGQMPRLPRSRRSHPDERFGGLGQRRSRGPSGGGRGGPHMSHGFGDGL